MKYSVIIPYYNAKNTIGNLLSSIPKRDDIQIIVIDDHSYDSPDFLLKEYARDNFVVVKQVDGKKGAGAARNLGLKYSLGDYLLFADADDFFINDAFSILDKYAHGVNDLVLFSPTSVLLNSLKKSNRHLPYCILVQDFISGKNDNAKYKFYVPWSKLIRRDLVFDNKIQFDEIIASNDVMFSLKIGFYSKSLKAVDENVYCVTDSDNSLIKQTSEPIFDARFKALVDYNKWVLDNGASEKRIPMIIFLMRSLRFGAGKFFSSLFFLIRHKLPIFYSVKNLLFIFKRMCSSKV